MLTWKMFLLKTFPPLKQSRVVSETIILRLV